MKAYTCGAEKGKKLKLWKLKAKEDLECGANRGSFVPKIGGNMREEQEER